MSHHHLNHIGALAGTLITATLLAAPVCAITPADAERYTREQAWVYEPLHPAAADLREELAAEITRLLDRYDADGHLEPAFHEIGITGSWILHGHPAEQAYILAEALPFLDTNLQARVKTYLFTEVRDFDPTEIAFEHCDWGWGNCQMTGNRREFFAIPASPNPDPVTPNLWPPPTVQPETLYMLWKYAEASGDWNFISTTTPPTGDRWNRILALFNTIPDPPARYGHIAGAIGFARILRHYNLTNSTAYTTALARVHSGLLAGTNFSAFVDTAYANFVGNYHDWAWTPFHYQRTANAVGAMFAPEIGRFLHDHALADVTRRTTYNPDEDQPGEQPAITGHWPTWYLTRGYYPPILTWMGFYGENHMITPDTPWALFMTHAWIYQNSGDQLRTLLDVPYSIGDLFHLQRLTATITAYGGPVWSPAEPPRIRAETTLDGALRVIANGASNTWYTVEGSTSFTLWQSITTNTGPEFILTNFANESWQFFRARLEP